jgi:deoxycytidylate deaminase
MFPIALIRHINPELFFAIIAPVGADLDGVCSTLKESLARFDYKLEQIRVIEQLKQFPGFLSDEPTAEDRKIEGRMNAGDNFRVRIQRPDALALLAVWEIVRFRNQYNREHHAKITHLPRQAYLFRSLKRPEEVTALRRIYGSNLIVIGVHSGREQRLENLAERIAKSRFSAQRDKFRDKAEKLILRDESDEQKPYGQRLRATFALADFFLNSSDGQEIAREIDRFLDLLFGRPVVTPRADELGMAHAYISAMRSSEMGRQVGAAITDAEGNLIACGTNEVPKGHGGYYWDGAEYDKRDWRIGVDSSDQFKRSSLGELLQVLSEKKLLSTKFSNLSTPRQIERLAPLIKQTRYMQLIEFVRAVHGEMSALIDAAFRGISVKNCTMFVTTFPCHECARHIVASGIERVVYIEPYAKSLALELHGDSIQLDISGDRRKIPFNPFLGVAPRNFPNIFAMHERKSSDGNVIEWNPISANPRVSGSFWSYLPYEKEDLKFLSDDMKKIRELRSRNNSKQEPVSTMKKKQKKNRSSIKK